jgi:ABC-type branched-subunit amino acid transport system substrate-binding protein
MSLLAFVLLLALGACQLGEAPTPAPEAAPLEGPALEPGPEDPDVDRSREAARLLEQAESSLRAGDYSGALEAAGSVETRLGNVPGTARALWIRARAHRGLEEWDAADRAVHRFLERIPPEDRLHPEAALLRAHVRVRGELPGDVEALFQVPAQAPDEVLDPLEGLAEEVSRTLDPAALRDLIDEAPRHPRVLPVFQVELAVRRSLLGDRDVALQLARAALELSPGARTAERARRVIDDELEELERGVLVLGSILSEGGPPSLRDLSARISEGIEVALVELERQGIPIRLETADDGGSSGAASDAVARLEAAGVTGLVGPLVDDPFEAAARARRLGVPMVSPTVRLLPSGVGDVMSLTGVDPAASRALARLAVDAGIREVVVLHPRTGAMTQEAMHFRQAFQELGGTVRREVVYNPGTTNFADPFGQVVSLRPQGLVLILPPEDVELVAPQIAYFGVDDLEIAILGSEAWSSEGVLMNVNPRHTEGVLTVSSRSGPDSFGPRWDAFVDSYESHFQRTLRSPLPALGYDAALLLIHAARQGDGSPQGTARALASIRGFEGATGVLDVVDGRIQRSYEPVRIEDRQPVPFRP